MRYRPRIALTLRADAAVGVDDAAVGPVIEVAEICLDADGIGGIREVTLTSEP